MSRRSARNAAFAAKARARRWISAEIRRAMAEPPGYGPIDLAMRRTRSFPRAVTIFATTAGGPAHLHNLPRDVPGWAQDGHFALSGALSQFEQTPSGSWALVRYRKD